MPNRISNSIFSKTAWHKSYIIALVAGFLFLSASLFYMVAQNYLFLLLPVFMLLLVLAFLSLDKFFLILLFAVPLSVQLRFLVNEPPADLFLPTEIMAFIILIIMFYKVVGSREYDSKLLTGHISIIVFAMLVWMLVTALTGEMKGVSLKYFVARLWFVSAFYFLALELFSRPGFIKKALLAYMAGMVPVVIYNLSNLYRSGLFNQKAAHSSMEPFFNDHTSFGAALAFLIPVCIWFVYKASPGIKRMLYLMLLLIFIAGIVFSYSRAAWISLIAGLVFGVLMLLKIPWRVTVPSAIIAFFIIVILWPSIVIKLNDINQGSSGNMAEHLHSVANISSDDSNMERINRWKCALKMGAERPLSGYGAGSYQFLYAPYQLSYDRTSISTNFGTRGNAHSEFLGAFAETGAPGAIIFILLIIVAIAKGLRAWDKNTDQRYLVLAMLCGLLTYVIHGALNNFLDTDKIASLFWMYIAALVILKDRVSNPESAIRGFTKRHAFPG